MLCMTIFLYLCKIWTTYPFVPLMYVFICIKSSEERSNRSRNVSIPGMNSLFESSLSPLCEGAHRPRQKQIINKSSRHKSFITHQSNIMRRWLLTSFVLEVLGVFPHERDPKICNDNRQGIRAQKMLIALTVWLTSVYLCVRRPPRAAFSQGIRG